MILSKNAFKACEQFILNNGRTLEQKKYACLFYHEEPTSYLEVLKTYQNDDGGFGHGLEPDAITPHSSPFQTSVGLSYLQFCDNHIKAKEMIRKAIHYLQQTFDKERKGWYAFNKDVNDYPHTPWWEYNDKEKMTPIDHHYGNPTAHIVSLLVRYKQYVEKLDIEVIINCLLDHIEGIDTFISEHELYCFIHLYKALTGDYKNRLEKALTKGIQQLVDLDQDNWKEKYVPQPLHFISEPNMCQFGIDNKSIEDNLNFLINELEENHRITPPWGDVFYTGEFKSSYEAWVVINTFKALLTLKSFNQIKM